MAACSPPVIEVEGELLRFILIYTARSDFAQTNETQRSGGVAALEGRLAEIGGDSVFKGALTGVVNPGTR
jgi:hypothetical protein